ncbi:MAG: F0F1 ATP synthase subunit A [Bacteroidetes bacterium]|nr:F0F1 ATP synthase subunit A [Bacteroidota bacterium]MCW5894627.1 F0F1 ATP synthase subunit A [Bacteroidota bacterium]
MYAFFQAGQDTTHHAAQQVADTAHAAATDGKMSVSEMFKYLFEHVQDSNHLELPFLDIHLPHWAPIEIAGLTLDLSPTKHVLFLWFGAAALILLMALAARANKKNRVPKGWGNVVEVFVKFIRDEIVIPNMGMAGIRYMPYVLTTFFFILLMNLLGLVPYGASATGNISVTAGLAVIAFVMIQVSAIRAQGFGHYLAHLTGGVPVFLWPIMIPIEILGLFTKPFALCIRLFANITGGHLVIVSLFGLIFLFNSWVIGVTTAAFVVAINFLELFVAFLQAYVFTMLTCIFMGLGIQAGHGEHHGEAANEHGH